MNSVQSPIITWYVRVAITVRRAALCDRQLSEIACVDSRLFRANGLCARGIADLWCVNPHWAVYTACSEVTFTQPFHTHSAPACCAAIAILQLSATQVR